MNKDYKLVVLTGIGYVGRQALIAEELLNKLQETIVVSLLEDFADR